MYTDIDSEAYREQFGNRDNDKHQLIDVREEEEYAAAHIPGALNIPLSELPARFDEISEDRPALLVCNTGIRSSQAALFLAGMGYEDLYNLEDGTKGWMKKGYPVEGEELD
ncbi:MAG: rhodanese-like domain-containing protein [Chloroflexota bacterium]|nr:rhodanese-like domain-containing protein [Chloroflexota bacterium]